jgi:hypothetical protein
MKVGLCDFLSTPLLSAIHCFIPPIDVIATRLMP